MLPWTALQIPLLSFAVFLPIVLTPLTFLVGRVGSWRAAAVFCNAALLIPLLIMVYLTPDALSGKTLYEEYQWVPALGLTVGFVLDSLSYPFALLITLVGFLAGVYSSKYMEKEHGLTSYFTLLLLFVAGMLGVVLVTNLFLFYIFWELMLIPSYALIAYWGTGNPRLIGFKYFIFTHAGALSLLIGIAWLAALFNNLNIFELGALAASQAAALRPVLTTIAVLIFIGAAVKMAVFPFHTWLPDAHAEAPTPISVLLSGVMIKTGVYAVARLVLGILPFTMVDLRLPVAVLAVLSMVWGGVMALVQNDVKRLLAYSSISQIGYIVFGLATGNVAGIQGGLFHVLNHGFAKSLLFMGAGVLIHELNERDIRRLGGLASKMPLTATAMLLGGLSIAGTPPLGGFMSEWMIFTGGIEAGWTVFVAIAIFATAITAGYYLRMIRAVFFGQAVAEAKDPAISMLGPMSPLIVLVVVLGFLAAPLVAVIADTASALSLYIPR
ncbi:MAG: NADH-quinone oxidoreductase subunit L [Candidatus Caldarchaeum sp.]|nr:NADH-quinone oxidoreductase subunit L [Candidatus Caldarchaeum sp.]MCS7134135.1 NADH-quinone oxidoreductase subunit L [Candidatus Caldarchaeum sp.]MCX8201132.1 NADH-quinone oxidoreductase subunit L [Candidatus Caldarchaeum sp.]MDW8435172.1 NADH-quinone oxidoreductase subunit L [Candidatus Caldarchaeum sp.]